jgi:hypothetical protein
MDTLIKILIIFILILAIFYINIYFLNEKLKKNAVNTDSTDSTVNVPTNSKAPNTTSCNINSCGAIDAVSDPSYNMQQIVKQSILLEEHLCNKNKRCRDCITKHFLHIIGLAEEAQMLATNKIENYPLLLESCELYSKLFKTWLKDTYNTKTILYCCDELRTMRKKLIVAYFFKGDLH